MRIFQAKSGFNRIIRENGVLYFITAGILFGLKLFYSRAASDQLIWILAPTTHWVEILSGIPFEYESGMGFVNHELRYLIAPSCSGINFMLISIAVLVFSFVHRIGSSYRKGNSERVGLSRLLKVLWLAGSVIFSYLFTIFVNGLRIILAIYLPDFFREMNLFGEILTWERLHTVIGTAVYFTSLLMIYGLADSVSRKIAGMFGKDVYNVLCKNVSYRNESYKNRLYENKFYGNKVHENASCINVSCGNAPCSDILCTSCEPAMKLSEEKWCFGVVKKCILPLFWYFLITLGVPFLNRAYQKNGEDFWTYSLLVLFVCGIVTGACILTGFLSRQYKCQHRRL